jgi:hypothetical protein
LQHLDLSGNLLVGGIPRSLGNCSKLEALFHGRPRKVFTVADLLARLSSATMRVRCRTKPVVCCRSRRPCAVTTPGFPGSGSLTSITQRWKTAAASPKMKSTVPGDDAAPVVLAVGLRKERVLVAVDPAVEKDGLVTLDAQRQRLLLLVPRRVLDPKLHCHEPVAVHRCMHAIHR